MTRHRSIRQRLLIDQILVILLLGGGILATTFFGARRAVETVSREVVERAADQAEGELRRFFDPITAAVLALGAWGRSGLLDVENPRRLVELTAPLVARVPQISGVLVADGQGREHFLRRSGDLWRSRLTRAGEEPGRSRWLTWPAEEAGGEPEESWQELVPPEAGQRNTYDPRSRPWYQGAVTLRQASAGAAAAADAALAVHWTEPYRFFTEQRPGITAALVYDAGDGVERVVAIDVLLEDLARHSRAVRVSERGSLWISTEDRRLLAWPDDPQLWRGRDPSTALLGRGRDLGLELIDDAVEALADRPDPTEGEPVRFASGGEDWWALGRRFAISDERGLAIAVVVPHADLLGDRQRLRRWILLLTLAVLAGAVARAAVLARRFSRPIEALVADSDRISQGDLEPGRPIPSRLAEVHRLTDAHDRMRRGLKTLMKLEGDLQLARQIQQKTFPSELPTLSGFDLVAWSRPADETGGDSYDVIGLDSGGLITDGVAERAVLLLADATGHGIGPALSVTQLRAMLRMAVRTGSDLKEVASHINEQLYADLPGNRFITAWLAVLDADGGTLTTYSAGQAPLLLYRAAGGEVEVLNADAPPMGLLPAIPVLPAPPIEMRPGDVYAALSDGFFEAVDASGMEFGKERLGDLLVQHRRAGAAEILAALRAALREFTGDAPLDDDRTAVIVKRTE